MNGFPSTLTAAMASEHQRDLLRAAAEARRALAVTDTADQTRHSAPVHVPSWWTRVASLRHSRPQPTGA